MYDTSTMSDVDLTAYINDLSGLIDIKTRQDVFARDRDQMASEIKLVILDEVTL